MRNFKGILLTGTAILALVACSSDKGPGEIGSLDDIVVRNAGEKAAPPPPREPVKEVKIAEGLSAEPSASDLIAAEDTSTAKTVEETAAAAQEAQEKAIAQAEQAGEQTVAAAQDAVVAEAQPAIQEASASVPDTAPGMAWNQPRRIASQEEADKLVEEQMAQSEPPVVTAPAEAPVAETAPAVSAPAPTQVAAAPAAAPTPLIPVTATENYKQDPDAPYSPAAARAAAVAQTGTPSDAPVSAAPASAPQAAPVPAPAPMTLAKVDGQMPLDPAVLQSKDPAAIRSLQKTLADAGFYKGALNGEMNSDTLNAYVKYQTAAQAASPAPAAPAPAPVAEAAPAPTPVMADEPVVAPTPVMQQAPAAPAPVTGMSETPYAMDAKVASPRPLVSRRTPKPLPPVEPMKVHDGMTASPAPAVQHMSPAPFTAPAMPQVAASAAPSLGANVSVTDPAVITAVQKALSAKGLYTGTAHGTMDADTLNAVIRYQAANKLSPGPLNIETLKSMGLVAQ